ncbi:MAG: hypothetical protein AAF960_29405, partial [Bacteroidota bacterium]
IAGYFRKKSTKRKFKFLERCVGYFLRTPLCLWEKKCNYLGAIVLGCIGFMAANEPTNILSKNDTFSVRMA